MTDIGLAIDVLSGHSGSVDARREIAGSRCLRHGLVQQRVLRGLLMCDYLLQVDAVHRPQQPAGDRAFDAVPVRSSGLTTAAAHVWRAGPCNEFARSGSLDEDLAGDGLQSAGVFDEDGSDGVVSGAGLDDGIDETRAVERDYTSFLEHVSHHAAGPFRIERHPPEFAADWFGPLVMRERIASPARMRALGRCVDVLLGCEPLHQLRMDSADPTSAEPCRPDVCTPPGMSKRSIMMVRAPMRAAWSAAAKPPGPPPTTTMSAS